MAQTLEQISWPHQRFCAEELTAAVAAGFRRVCVTSPTGGGKTAMMIDAATGFLERGEKAVLYTNRKGLVDQTSRVFARAGLEHGVRSAGYGDDRHLDLQVSSIQTEASRVLKRKRWELHDAKLVLVDEAHNQTGAVAKKIFNAHTEEGGAILVGFTATPLGLADFYDKLIVAGTTSELRDCGALVPCVHYGCDEPDLRSIGKVPLGQDLSEKQNIKAIMVEGIFGRVFEWWQKLNPEAKPTILFAPGVAESIWFAEQFHANGVSAAHIDGENVWVNGKFYPTSREARDEVLEGSKDGTISVVCNRFVLREGIDAPWLCHGILATVFGSLKSYLQAGGRLLRAHPGIEAVTLQDHGGNWWRHGSLNSDREWSLEYTDSIVAGFREDAFRSKKEKEPFRCPSCGRVWIAGTVCRQEWGGCGFELQLGKRSRAVVQSDGTLREMTGDIFRARRVSQKPNAQQLWERMYYRSHNTDRTFRAAEALFAAENNWGWPDHGFPLMPIEPLDWFRRVKDVPRERLTKE